MALQYLNRNRTALIKLESVPGEDAMPTAAANAVRVLSLAWQNGFTSIQSEELGGGLDRQPEIPAGGQQGFSLSTYLKGAPGAGILPEIDPLLQAATWAPTIVSTAVTGTAEAGDAELIELAAGASAVDGYYIGMPLAITGGTGSGQTRTIVAYDGASRIATVDQPWATEPDDTSAYAIGPCIVYRPVSSNTKTVTVHDYAHRADGGLSRLLRSTGAVGAFEITGEANAAPRVNWTMVGALQLPSDVPHPGTPVYQDTAPTPLMGAFAYLDGVRAHLAGFSISSGGEPQSAPDITAPFGTSDALVTGRAVSGSIRLPDELLATRNFLEAWRASTRVPFVVQWGPALPGRRVMLTIPQLQYGPPERTEVNGFLFQQVPFSGVGTDSALFITIY